ncbi:GIY-YIG nuclease family protein [Halomonas sp. YLB-10]|nr:GIY-YIG nuclease family protein [Halomonas sp. YLB-10]
MNEADQFSAAAHNWRLIQSANGISMLGTFDDLKAKVDEYCSCYRHPKMGDLSSGPLYDLFPEREGGALKAKCCWNDTWPSNGKAGIYAFLDDDGRVVYIGKSSMKSSVSARLNSYCQYGQNKKCKLKHDHWKVQPRYVWIVGVPNETSFEAAALEEFLIREIVTSCNVNGVSASP